MRKRFICLLFALLFLGAVPLAARAHDVPQSRDDCSMELLVSYKDIPINSGDFTAILVGYVDEDDGNYFFRRCFTHEALTAQQVQSSGAAEDLLKFYSDNKGKYDFTKINVAITKGVAKFENLPTGLYLLTQDKACNGYSKLSPFLVSLPYEEDGVYRYQLTAKVKTELEEQKPTPTKPSGGSGKPSQKLPQTGQLNWPVPVMAVAGMVLFLLGWCLRFGQRRETYAA